MQNFRPVQACKKEITKNGFVGPKIFWPFEKQPPGLIHPRLIPKELIIGISVGK